MAVTLTSPALGLDVGDPYTGPEEAWLLAQGYARRDGYTGPGVANSGPADTTPTNDVTKAENREGVAAGDWLEDAAGPLDPAMILPGDPGYDDGDPENPQPVNPEREGDMDPAYDFDAGGVDDDVVA